MNRYDYEIPLGYNNLLAPCFTYYLRFKNCVSSENLVKLTCHEKFADYKECKVKDRARQYRTWYTQEYKKIKLLSLPEYDDVTDSFVDGVSPDSADSFFNNSEKMKNFFDLNENAKSKHDAH